MAQGFIYVVASLGPDYRQPNRYNVPSDWTDPIYFGPCKIPIRKKMIPGDWLFGISPAKLRPPRIVYIAQVEERITFSEAYGRYPKLRGPDGPIHVRPVNKPGQFPHSTYEHIKGSMHPYTWESDLKSPDLDAFFVCFKADGKTGRWLGIEGPIINDEILSFLQKCSVHGSAGQISNKNNDATKNNPVCHGHLYRGIHLETDSPEKLIELCHMYRPSEMMQRYEPAILTHLSLDRRNLRKKSRKGCCE